MLRHKPETVNIFYFLVPRCPKHRSFKYTYDSNTNLKPLLHNCYHYLTLFLSRGAWSEVPRGQGSTPHRRTSSCPLLTQYCSQTAQTTCLETVNVIGEIITTQVKYPRCNKPSYSVNFQRIHKRLTATQSLSPSFIKIYL